MNCPHCGMPETARHPFEDVTFIAFGCGVFTDSNGAIDPPTTACREIARLNERVRTLEEGRLIVVERYADNGELSHHEVLKANTGESIGVIALGGGKESV